MKWISTILYFAALSVAVMFTAKASTRAPKMGNENSLLYWRYLCENQVQSETLKSEGAHYSVELSCPSQHWKIRTEADQVKEVVEDAKK